MTDGSRRILVTGASGFLGRAIVAAGAQAGLHMIAVSRSGSEVAGAAAAQASGDLASGIDAVDFGGVDAVVNCAARAGVPLPLAGIDNARSFCFCDDLIEGFLRFMEVGPDMHGPMNIGNPAEFTIRELAEKVLGKIGGKSKLITAPLPQDDPMQRRPDISKTKEALRWGPKVDLDEGLDRTIAYFRKVVRG